MTDSTAEPLQNATMLNKKKRTRVQLSCTACRSRKLKCCRTYPCTNCKKRGEATSCTFVGRGPLGKSSQGQASLSQVQNRLQHLENLILSFTQRKINEQNRGLNAPVQQDTPPRASGSDIQALHGAPSTGSNPGMKEAVCDTSGRLLVKEAGTSYFDNAHWRAILEQVNEVKGYLQESEEESEDEVVAEDPFESSSPALLLGMSKPSKEELLADIPSRPVADRLVSQFLHCKDPFLVVIHYPTFQKEYNQFWKDPQGVSSSWLGLLFGVLTLAVSILKTTEEPLPQSLGNYLDAMNRFRKRTVQCLVQANYITPGRYKVEALFLYTMGEFFRSQDTQAGISFLLGLTIKLAMRMGYHRDPRHFSGISAFEGEMRRRLWAVVSQFDTLISFHVGLPRTIQSWQHDVELPRNLFDEDINESMERLPPSRPETERTALCYTRAKGRIMSVFGRISDLAFSREPVTYEQTLEIDRYLEEAHDRVPSILRIRPMEQSITDPSDLILNRLTLELLYQKCRCVLHRRYLAEVHGNMRYAYSRWVCMTAAKEILRHQTALYHETQPGGQLYRDRQFPNSIQSTDYLLAAMIICLELSFSHRGSRPDDANNNAAVTIKGREDLLAALETSHQIFEDMRRRSADARKAYAAMTIMLRRVKRGLQDPPSGSSGDSSARGGISSNSKMAAPDRFQKTNTGSASPLPYDGWQYPQDPPSMTAQDQINPMQQFGSLDVIEGMLDAPANLDWRLWDQQIQGFEDNTSEFWYPAFSP